MKKGFTLVEMLAVIVIISITSMIVFPTISSVILRSKKSLYESQIDDIKKAADKWANEHSDLLDDTHVNDTYIFLESLRYSGYLETDEIKNPLDRTTMNGCIRVKFDESSLKYNYDYEEKNCKTYARSGLDDPSTYGYLIYKYDRDTDKFNLTSDSNKLYSLGKFIYNAYSNAPASGDKTQNIIKSNGETESGLYDIGDEYVFRGSNPRNFVKLDSKYWRILSINKNDYTVKLIGTSAIASNKWSDSSLDFSSSTISRVLLDNGVADNVAYNFNKIIDADYQTGVVVDSPNYSIDALASELSKKLANTKENNNEVTTKTINTASQKIGSISVLDYVNASATEECPSNYLSNSCKNNNYLYSIFGDSDTTWTINNDEEKIWYINRGLLSLSAPSAVKKIYPVITLSSSAYVINSDVTGSDTNNAFELK